LQPVIVLDEDMSRIYHQSLSDILTDTNHCMGTDILIDPIKWQHTLKAIHPASL
jgi:hypothetical protein